MAHALPKEGLTDTSNLLAGPVCLVGDLASALDFKAAVAQQEPSSHRSHPCRRQSPILLRRSHVCLLLPKQQPLPKHLQPSSRLHPM